MLHLLFISPHSDPQADLREPDSGGQCIYEHELALALSHLPDFKITTFCRQNRQRPLLTLVNTSYSIVRIPCGGSEFIPKEEIERVLPEFVLKIKDFLGTPAADEVRIIHAHYWDGGYAALRLKWLTQTKLPLVWTPHSLGCAKRKKFPGLSNELNYNFITRQLWESYASMMADKVVVSSEKEKILLMNEYSIDNSKIEITPPGVTFQNLVPLSQARARRQLAIPMKAKILLCLGRIVKTKGYHRAIAALYELKKLYHQPVKLLIIGGSTHPTSPEEIEYRLYLRSLIEELSLQEDVIMLPALAHDQVTVAFSAADIFLMPSLNEPFGLVTLEAMATKTPVVAANTGSTLNLISHNQTGILTTFDEPRRVAQYLLSLLKDKELSELIANKAYKKVILDFDWYNKAEKFSQIYREISRQGDVDNFFELVQTHYFLQRHFV